jgi:hypothetical protein
MIIGINIIIMTILLPLIDIYKGIKNNIKIKQKSLLSTIIIFYIIIY